MEDVMATYPVDDVPDDARAAAFDISGFWWLYLVSGAIWIVAALVVLQFDGPSVTTVGVIVGIMFLFAAAEQLILAWTAEGPWRVAAVIFGVLLAVAGVLALANPEKTFAGIADMLGFLFLIVAAMWIVRALVELGETDLWWVRLISGLLMLILAFWTSGQFFIDRAYLLLVFAGIWALIQGVNDIVLAFVVRGLHKALA
jgi:uncharacterized membrane protein HdeD (DUF308 family)